MKNVFLIGVVSLFVMVSCTKPTSAPKTETDLSSVIKTYSMIVHASYEDSLLAAKEMQAKINAFIEKPAQKTLDAAKESWLVARVPYGQTEVYRFYGGPIDDEDGPEGQLNAWPLDEAYIDYVEGNTKAGIINDTSFAITKEKLMDANEKGGEANVSTGYHAIEFLLWGQDLTTDGPGHRPVWDFTTETNHERRIQYLQVVTEILIADLESLVAEWSPNNPNNYRAQFEAKDPKLAVQQILSAMGILSKGELAGERMRVALVNHDQEDEHSCFSDNTHVDIQENARGIQNVYLGKYTRLDGSVVQGTSFSNFVSTSVDTKMKKELATSMELVNGIQAPFDQEISARNPTGNQRVRSAIDALQAQSSTIVAVATDLGIPNLNVELPE